MSNKSIEFFKSLFDDSPNLAILNINNGCDDINNLLQDIANSSGGKLVTKNIGDIAEEKFRLTDREFEYAVICDALDSIKDKERFLTKIYNSLETSAQILVLSRKGNIDIFQIKELLEEVDFGSPNEVDIFNQYNLVVANKMQMWCSR